MKNFRSMISIERETRSESMSKLEIRFMNTRISATQKSLNSNSHNSRNTKDGVYLVMVFMKR